MAELEKISDQELRFCIALSSGKPPTVAATTAGYSTGHAKNLLARETVKEAILLMGVSLASVIVKHYGIPE